MCALTRAQGDGESLHQSFLTSNSIKHIIITLETSELNPYSNLNSYEYIIWVFPTFLKSWCEIKAQNSRSSHLPLLLSVISWDQIFCLTKRIREWYDPLLSWNTNSLFVSLLSAFIEQKAFWRSREQNLGPTLPSSLSMYSVYIKR